jgi:hypothetical protein
MLKYVTDTTKKKKVAISSKHVVAVFEIPDGEHEGKTGINMVNGSIIVEESDIEVVAMFNEGLQ